MATHILTRFSNKCISLIVVRLGSFHESVNQKPKKWKSVHIKEETLNIGMKKNLAFYYL